ncbi:unnamed protein product [Mesocestoides corti]|uniref:Uncharacterized protein n=1 Tax=Mesocestoides corti TaxID=53468 RepID=A0A158QTL6_MESCO|nr:unnamed protein product [Mesocestoides corti]
MDLCSAPRGSGKQRSGISPAVPPRICSHLSATNITTATADSNSPFPCRKSRSTVEPATQDGVWAHGVVPLHGGDSLYGRPSWLSQREHLGLRAIVRTIPHTDTRLTIPVYAKTCRRIGSLFLADTAYFVGIFQTFQRVTEACSVVVQNALFRHFLTQEASVFHKAVVVPCLVDSLSYLTAPLDNLSVLIMPTGLAVDSLTSSQQQTMFNCLGKGSVQSSPCVENATSAGRRHTLGGSTIDPPPAAMRHVNPPHPHNFAQSSASRPVQKVSCSMWNSQTGPSSPTTSSQGAVVSSTGATAYHLSAESQTYSPTPLHSHTHTTHRPQESDSLPTRY